MLGGRKVENFQLSGRYLPLFYHFLFFGKCMVKKVLVFGKRKAQYLGVHGGMCAQILCFFAAFGWQKRDGNCS